MGRIERLLRTAGVGMTDVVRTRIYMTDMDRFSEVASVHGELFATTRPTTSVVGVTALAAPGLFVEIEVEAIAGAGNGIRSASSTVELPNV